MISPGCSSVSALLAEVSDTSPLCHLKLLTLFLVPFFFFLNKIISHMESHVSCTFFFFFENMWVCFKQDFLDIYLILSSSIH